MLREATKKLDCSGRSLSRADGDGNEDRFLIGHLCKSMLVSGSNTRLGDQVRLFSGSQGHVLLVADGLGRTLDGLGGAEVAAELIVQQFLSCVPWLYGLDDARFRRLRSEIESVVERCHGFVSEAPAATDSEPVGAALTAGLVLWPQLHLVHLGDSRAYLVRRSRLRRLTTDHVRRVNARGARPLLTNALGAGILRPTAELSRVDLEEGDCVLLCTSGLLEALDEERLLREVERAPSSASAADALVDAARAEGAQDDATVVVACFARTDTNSTPPGTHSQNEDQT